MDFVLDLTLKSFIILHNNHPVDTGNKIQDVLSLPESMNVSHYRPYDCCEYPPGVYGAAGGGSGV